MYVDSRETEGKARFAERSAWRRRSRAGRKHVGNIGPKWFGRPRTRGRRSLRGSDSESSGRGERPDRPSLSGSEGSALDGRSACLDGARAIPIGRLDTALHGDSPDWRTGGWISSKSSRGSRRLCTMPHRVRTGSPSRSESTQGEGRGHQFGVPRPSGPSGPSLDQGRGSEGYVLIGVDLDQGDPSGVVQRSELVEGGHQATHEPSESRPIFGKSSESKVDSSIRSMPRYAAAWSSTSSADASSAAGLRIPRRDHEG